MHIVPMDGADTRFLGGSARARHARLAARVGASFTTLDRLAANGGDTVVLVPAQSALMQPLFQDPAFLDAAGQPALTLLEASSGTSSGASSGAFVVVGPAQLVASFAGHVGALTTLRRRALGPGTLLNIGTASARRHATRDALLATQKATDGWVSRTFNRPISRACSRVALAVGLSATGASLVTLVLGLVCAWVAAQPGHLAFVGTGVLFQLASVLDGMDGEIARATFTESERGARVDTIVDQLTYLTSFAGMTIGGVREGSGTTVLWLTLAIGAALVLTLMRAGRFVAAHASNASFVIIDRSVRRAARDTGMPTLHVAALLFTLLRRDLFAVLFLAVSLTGQRAAVPVLILAGTLVANLTFSLHGDALADAARAEIRT
ncbi:MAG: CDP-alcohol phosphatidyltransferase family protein [Vicinamibacterales bacterium]